MNMYWRLGQPVNGRLDNKLSLEISSFGVDQAYFRLNYKIFPCNILNAILLNYLWDEEKKWWHCWARLYGKRFLSVLSACKLWNHGSAYAFVHTDQRASAAPKPRPEVIRKLCSIRLSMKFFLHINVKMPIIIGISTFICRKNSIIGLYEAEKSWSSWTFYTYEHFKIPCSAELSMKKSLITPDLVASYTFH